MRYDVFVSSQSGIEGHWVIKAKSKKKAKRKFKKMAIADSYQIVGVKKHRITSGEEGYDDAEAD
jgi:hypothetical protein